MVKCPAESNCTNQDWVLSLDLLSSLVCEIQETTKDRSENIQVSAALLQFQINHSSWRQDLVKMNF